MRPHVACLLTLLLTSTLWAGPEGPPFWDRSRKTDEQEEAGEAAEDAAKRADVDEAVALLGDASAWVRDEAFYALEDRDDAELLRGLAPHLGHRDPLVRASVAELFAECEFAAGREALEKLGLRAPDVETVLESIWALEAIGSAESAKPLAKLAKRGGRLGFRVQGDALIALAKCDADAARELITEALEKPRGPQVIAALVALGELDAREAAAAAVNVIDGLNARDDWAPRILDAALVALRDWEDRDDAPLVVRAVDTLIALLAEVEGRSHHEVHLTLVELTGEALAADALAWKGWWDAQRERFEPPRGGTSTQAPEAETRVRYHGIPVHSQRLLFALDISTGMTSHKVDDDDPESPLRLTFSVSELARALESLPDDMQANVVFFATEYRFLSEQMVPVGKARRSMQQFVQREAKTPEGPGLSRSNMYDTLVVALADPRVDTIFLLSEGGPTEGRYKKRKRLARHLERQNVYSRVRLHVIQVAAGKKRTKFLRGLAEDLRGEFYDLDFLRQAHGF